MIGSGISTLLWNVILLRGTGCFHWWIPAPENDDQSKEATVDDYYLAELADQAFDTQGLAVPAAVAKYVQNHLNRDFAPKSGTKSHEDSSQPGMILSKFRNAHYG